MGPPRIVGWTGEFTFDRTKPDGMPRKVMDVSRSSPMRRNDPLRKSKVTLGVLPACLVGKLNPVHVYLFPLAEREDFRLTFDLS